MQFSNVLTAGMSGFQQIGTLKRRSTRLQKKRNEMIVQDLPDANLSERWQTSSRVEGDVIVLSLDELMPTVFNTKKAAGSITSESSKGTDT